MRTNARNLLVRRTAMNIVPPLCTPRTLYPHSPPTPNLPPGFFYPDPNVVSDIYAFSSHSQFHFSVSAGYFLWAAGVSIMYRGSRVAIAYYLTAFAACYFAMHPFMHQIGNIYLLSQASTLVLDLYGCGMLLRGKKSKVRHRILYIILYYIILLSPPPPSNARFFSPRSRSPTDEPRPEILPPHRLLPRPHLHRRPCLLHFHDRPLYPPKLLHLPQP